MAQLGRAAEAAGFSQTDEIFKPFGFHARNYARLGHATKPASAASADTEPKALDDLSFVQIQDGRVFMDAVIQLSGTVWTPFAHLNPRTERYLLSSFLCISHEGWWPILLLKFS